MKHIVTGAGALAILFSASDAAAQLCQGCGTTTSTIVSPAHPCGEGIITGGGVAGYTSGTIGTGCNPNGTGTTGSGSSSSGGQQPAPVATSLAPTSVAPIAPPTAASGTSTAAVRPTVPVTVKPLVPKPCVKDCK